MATTTLSTVFASATAAAPSSLETSILLGPFGAEGPLLASVITADESSTVYFVDCALDIPCDIVPFTVTEGTQDMLISTTYIGAPKSAEYSCTYTGTAEEDTLSCYYTTTSPISSTGEMTTTTTTTFYTDPTLYIYEITITGGFEYLEVTATSNLPTEPTSDSNDVTEEGGNVETNVVSSITSSESEPSSSLSSDDSTPGFSESDFTSSEDISGDEETDPVNTSSGRKVSESGIIAVIGTVIFGIVMI